MAKELFVCFILLTIGHVIGVDGGKACNGISRGRHFVIVYTGNYDNNPSETELSLIVVAFNDKPTTVTVSSKHLIRGAPFEETFTIEARGSKQTQLPVELLLGGNSNRSNKVVRVDADGDVSVFGLNYAPYTTDAFLAIPVNYLDVSYVATGYDSAIQRPSLFAVVGVEENTLVDIVFTATVTFDGTTYPAGTALKINIQKNEVFQFVAVSSNEYIGGSTITSDQPVAVFTGHMCASTPFSACDVLSEQVVPVSSWGRTHIYSATGTPQDNAIYVIHAYYEDTLVNITGFASVMLQPGQHWEGEITGSGVITTSKPASVAQVLNTINLQNVDPSLIQIPSEEQFGYKFGFSTPPKSGEDNDGFFNYFNIIVKEGESNNLLLNGRSLSDYGNYVSSHDVPGTDYEVFTVQVPKGEGVYFVEQASVVNTAPFSVTVYGYESYETYGYAAGLSLPSDERLLSINPYFLREVGREQLIATLPCLENNDIDLQEPVCRFHALTEQSNISKAYIDVEAQFVDFYTLICTSPMFYEVGYITVEIYLTAKNTSTSFIGTVFVVSQDVLPPVVEVQQANHDKGFINFSSNFPILLEWPSSALPDIETVNISFQVAIQDNDGLVLWTTDNFIAKEVNNTGIYEFEPVDLDEDMLAILGQAGTSSILFAIHSSVPASILGLRSAFIIVIGTTCLICLYNLEKPDLKNVDPCPCTDQQASVDGNFQRADDGIDFFHEGASSCYRSVGGSGTSGQQCCYRSDGNILVGPPGGGTVDAVAPGDFCGTFLHFLFDVIPWFWFCKVRDECDVYYEHRPSDDCSNYVPPLPTGGSGDPHFKSLDGKDFTFNGAGEFLLLRSSLHDVTFQVRMETLSGTNASVYTAFVISSNSSVPAQVQRSPMNDTLIVVDGIPLDMYYDGFLIRRLAFKGLLIEVNSDVSEVRILLRCGVALIVRISSEMMSFILQLPDVFKGQVHGLLGNFNGDPYDDFTLPNGDIVSPNSSLELIHFEFGLSWILQENSTIFTYFPPYDFSSYNKPSFIPNLEFPDVNDVSDDVKAVCGDSPPCLFDAVSTGSLSFANESLQEVHELETVVENSVKIASCGFPGKVANGYINGTVYLVGYNITITCEENFLLTGSSIMTCQEDGNWTSSLPSCDARESSLTPLALGLTVSLVIFTIAVASVFVVVSCALLLTRKQQLKHNVKEVPDQMPMEITDEYVYNKKVDI
ncbi:Sushi domain-containing protein 2 [Holothuria leucospilota]|uniref:Sushi domain-containing protein 2 n=1 Tax=Holothuria leucospilota TaxID=206669 RepID=A0A9Q1C3I2_HOLLE|nr:Sushi domain-containing protein 2 [Holothuria leucospilota]